MTNSIPPISKFVVRLLMCYHGLELLLCVSIRDLMVEFLLSDFLIFVMLDSVLSCFYIDGEIHKLEAN